MKFQKGHTLNRGRKMPPRTDAHRRKISEAKKGIPRPDMVDRCKALSEKQRKEKSPHWKGDGVSYNGLHKWVVNNFGRPGTCEHCGKDGLSGRSINWANVSGNYTRERDDWIRLCKSCHTKFDNLKKKS